MRGEVSLMIAYGVGLITITGEVGCRPEQAARIAAQALGFELVTESRLEQLLSDEFETTIPEKAYPEAAASVLARLALEHHLVIAAPGAEQLFRNFANVLRVHITAPSNRRIGNTMLDLRATRLEAKKALAGEEKRLKEVRRQRFRRVSTRPEDVDIVLNAEHQAPEGLADIITHAARARGIQALGLLPREVEAMYQFQLRLQLAKHGIQPVGKASLKRANFMHPSEEIFGNLLDFYRIAWEYEPRSFAIQWDKEGKPSEFFTPDFYLPEVDLYVELTTMKQSLVTKKNRKIKLLRTIYPHINIQVFYQKDFQDLVFKYGLAERSVPAR